MHRLRILLRLGPTGHPARTQGRLPGPMATRHTETSNRPAEEVPRHCGQGGPAPAGPGWRLAQAQAGPLAPVSLTTGCVVGCIGSRVPTPAPGTATAHIRARTRRWPPRTSASNSHRQTSVPSLDRRLPPTRVQGPRRDGAGGTPSWAPHSLPQGQDGVTRAEDTAPRPGPAPIGLTHPAR